MNLIPCSQCQEWQLKKGKRKDMKCLYEGLEHNMCRVYDNGITIVIRKTQNTFDVYYETDGFPLTFGFGLPDKGYTMSQVWGYAEANAHQICMALFMD